MERLARQAPKTRVLRLGHPARLLPEVKMKNIIKLSFGVSLWCPHCAVPALAAVDTAVERAPEWISTGLVSHQISCPSQTSDALSTCGAVSVGS